ncbi:phosphatase PAP2 family protein [Oxalicibacterium faecigallinarum]|uniref:Phosphatidic acid phosphatase type 2/haloperoxidase domain-containing protein n=1 Tax=Oxalicibacterium faecigallinarum TaxID=573741 RepID=A0A8J3AR98_9BURK|nr:phosphatase PAP2 family protein [Oxalicibacterium faecigallinarum]GGI20516.1 hypothetical protein GCM10008066_24420 [Oxalicibacterium faecigallinarum]
MDFWAIFTKLGDTNFTLPVALLLAIWLAAARHWRLALWWCILFGTGLFIVTASKVAYVGWGIGIASIDFRGFSGHAMRTATIAPPLAYLLFQHRNPETVRRGFLLGAAFGIAICISRLILGVHSVSEAVSGLLLGLFIAMLFVMLCERAQPVQASRLPLMIGLFALLPALLARPAPTQGWIEQVAIQLAGDRHRDEIHHRLGKPNPLQKHESNATPSP